MKCSLVVAAHYYWAQCWESCLMQWIKRDLTESGRASCSYMAGRLWSVVSDAECCSIERTDITYSQIQVLLSSCSSRLVQAQLYVITRVTVKPAPTSGQIYECRKALAKCYSKCKTKPAACQCPCGIPPVAFTKVFHFRFLHENVINALSCLYRLLSKCQVFIHNAPPC